MNKYQQQSTEQLIETAKPICDQLTRELVKRLEILYLYSLEVGEQIDLMSELLEGNSDGKSNQS